MIGGKRIGTPWTRQEEGVTKRKKKERERRGKRKVERGRMPTGRKSGKRKRYTRKIMLRTTLASP